MEIGVVLVTFNRLDELKKTLPLYDGQTRPPRYLLVVDNHSTDGTAEFLAAWREESGPARRMVLTLPENAGGSGGFCAGLQAALALEADWIWLADDDAYPAPDAFETLARFGEEHSTLMAQTAALCTRNHDERRVALGHRCRVRRTPLGAQLIPAPLSCYDRPYFDVDTYSFVGALLRRTALEKAGMPEKDFFIYADAFDHALRMRKQGRILCVPAADVFHRDNSGYSPAASWRDYYETRNLLVTYRRHFGAWAAFARGACRMLTACRSLNPEKIRLFTTAIRDARRGALGLHPLYRPGWQGRGK